MAEFKLVEAKPRSDVWADMLAQVEPGMAAELEKDEAVIKSIRALIWRFRSKYPDFYTYTTDEHFYVARKPAED